MTSSYGRPDPLQPTKKNAFNGDFNEFIKVSMVHCERVTICHCWGESALKSGTADRPFIRATMGASTVKPAHQSAANQGGKETLQESYANQ